MYFNKETLEFALAFTDVKAAFPETSIPANIKEIGDFVWYEPTPMPDHDPLLYSVQEDLPEEVNGVWTQIWELVPLTDEQKASAQANKVAQVKHDTVIEVQKRLDEFAQTRAYDGIVSLASYATSKKPKRQIEGQYGVDIRDAHWDKVYEIEAAVLAGTRPLPTVAEVLAEMPALEWPAEAV